MGNHALRKQAAAAIKMRGFDTKLYRNKAARKKFCAKNLRMIIDYCNLNMGDIVNDCDGFNHKIKGYANHYRSNNNQLKTTFFRKKRGVKNIKGYYFAITDFIFEDGMSCGCGLPGKPLSREHIEQRTLKYYTKFFKEFKENELMFVQKLVEHLRKGNHICDENGILLPEWEMKY